MRANATRVSDLPLLSIFEIDLTRLIDIFRKGTLSLFRDTYVFLKI